MNLTQFKEAVAQLPNSDNLAPIVETAGGNLLGVAEVRVDDGYAVITTGRVLVHRDVPPRKPRSAA